MRSIGKKDLIANSVWLFFLYSCFHMWFTQIVWSWEFYIRTLSHTLCLSNVAYNTGNNNLYFDSDFKKASSFFCLTKSGLVLSTCLRGKEKGICREA